MRHCPVCGTTRISADARTCLRESCGHVSTSAFPNLYQSVMPAVPGVAISPGGFWIRPHRSTCG